MAKVKVTTSSEPLAPMRPPLTPEAREQQLISLAVDLVEKRLREGTASSQETTHFLKQATAKYRLELQEKEVNNKLAIAKAEALQSQKRSEEMFVEAIKAFKTYSGQGGDDYDEEEYYD